MPEPQDKTKVKSPTKEDVQEPQQYLRAIKRERLIEKQPNTRTSPKYKEQLDKESGRFESAFLTRIVKRVKPKQQYLRKVMKKKYNPNGNNFNEVFK